MIIIETMIPSNYNDGPPIPRMVIDEALFAIAQQFGGYTIAGEGHGYWIGPDGRNYVEPNRKLSFACDERDELIAREMVLGLGRVLRQITMYFVVHRPDVSFLHCNED